MNKRSVLLTGLGALVLLVLLACLWAARAWRNARAGEAARDLVSGNGRIEAIEIDIATKQPGRVTEILVDEGDMVQAGQVVARMDLLSLQAQRNEAAAREQQARDAVAGAEAQLAMRRSDEAAAAALVVQRESELDAARRRLARSTTLAAGGATAAAQLVGARSAVAAALATTARIDADLRDGSLTAPRAGRIQYRVAQPGEVLGPGGKVLNLIDLTDVFMTFFVPETAAGRIALGSEVRLQLDAAPGFVVPARFNPALTPSWFGGVMEPVANVTMLSVVLTGAALIRERQHGTVEHLLAMPVSPLEIMLAKLWAMAAVVLLAALLALTVILRTLLHVGIQGSIPLFTAGAALHLFATCSLGILLATVARSMPQFGLLVILVLLPLNMLSGANTPRESIPFVLREAMLLAPTTHFVELSQAILFRGAGLDVVWRPFLALLAIGAVLFAMSLARFGKAMRQD